MIGAAVIFLNANEESKADQTVERIRISKFLAQDNDFPAF